MALAKVGLTNAQALIDGLVVSLGSEDNRLRYTASAEQIRANVDTILKLLAPNALTSGLGLINSLVTSMGGKSLTDIVAAATAIKDGVSNALDLLKGKGTQVAKDLAQELYDKLLEEKARLVALAQSIAAAIAAALAAAAASIGVTVDVPDFPDIKDGDGDGDGDGDKDPKTKDPKTKDPKTKDPKKKDPKKLDPKKLDPKKLDPKKLTPPKSKTQFELAKESVNKAKNMGRNIVAAASMPNFRPEATKKLTVGPAAPRGFMRTPVPAPKMTGSNTVPVANRPFGGGNVANVTINTTKAPTASQTKQVVSGALKGAANAKKGK